MINLRPSDSKDIALHLNAQVENQVFVRNSYINDSWGEEEKEIASFPFSPGMYLEVRLTEPQHQLVILPKGLAVVFKYHVTNKVLNKTAIPAFQCLDNI